MNKETMALVPERYSFKANLRPLLLLLLLFPCLLSYFFVYKSDVFFSTTADYIVLTCVLLTLLAFGIISFFECAQTN